jgi:hypothetical protein
MINERGLIKVDETFLDHHRTNTAEAGSADVELGREGTI